MRKIIDGIKNFFKSDKIFAEGFCFDKMFLIFVIFSVIGSLYEEVVNFSFTYFRTGELLWETRTALIYGKFNLIYGAGAVLFLLILGRKNFSYWKVFIYSFLIGGAFEYIISVLQEIFVGTTSWDYSQKILNIGGRTTIPYMIVWGILGMLLVKIVYPFLSNLIEKIPYPIGKIIVFSLVVFLVVDMFLSFGALIRQNLRRRGIKAYTKLGEMFDRKYPDDFMKRFYPNMKVSG